MKTRLTSRQCWRHTSLLPWLALVWFSVPLLGAAAADSDSHPLVLSVISGDSPLSWAGLLADGRIAGAQVDWESKTLLAYRERPVAASEVGDWVRRLREGGIMELATAFSEPLSRLQRAPGVRLTRLSIWQGGRTHEISVAGMGSAPEPLRRFIGELIAQAGSAPVQTVPAAVRLFSVHRKVGVDGETEAQRLERAGKHFLDLEPHLAHAPPVLHSLLRYPGTLQPLTPSARQWLDALPGWEGRTLYVKRGSLRAMMHLLPSVSPEGSSQRKAP